MTELLAGAASERLAAYRRVAAQTLEHGDMSELDARLNAIADDPDKWALLLRNVLEDSASSDELALLSLRFVSYVLSDLWLSAPLAYPAPFLEALPALLLTHLRAPSRPHLVAALFVLQQQVLFANHPPAGAATDQLVGVVAGLALSATDAPEVSALAAKTLGTLVAQAIPAAVRRASDALALLLRELVAGRMHADDAMWGTLHAAAALPIPAPTPIAPTTPIFPIDLDATCALMTAISAGISAAASSPSPLTEERLASLGALWRHWVAQLPLDVALQSIASPAPGSREGLLMHPVAQLQRAQGAHEYGRCLAWLARRLVLAATCVSRCPWTERPLLKALKMLVRGVLFAMQTCTGGHSSTLECLACLQTLAAHSWPHCEAFLDLVGDRAIEKALLGLEREIGVVGASAEKAELLRACVETQLSVLSFLEAAPSPTHGRAPSPPLCSLLPRVLLSPLLASQGARVLQLWGEGLLHACIASAQRSEDRGGEFLTPPGLGSGTGTASQGCDDGLRSLALAVLPQWLCLLAQGWDGWDPSACEGSLCVVLEAGIRGGLLRLPLDRPTKRALAQVVSRGEGVVALVWMDRGLEEEGLVVTLLEALLAVALTLGAHSQRLQQLLASAAPLIVWQLQQLADVLLWLPCAMASLLHPCTHPSSRPTIAHAPIPVVGASDVGAVSAHVGAVQSAQLSLLSGLCSALVAEVCQGGEGELVGSQDSASAVASMALCFANLAAFLLLLVERMHSPALRLVRSEASALCWARALGLWLRTACPPALVHALPLSDRLLIVAEADSEEHVASLLVCCTLLRELVEAVLGAGLDAQVCPIEELLALALVRLVARAGERGDVLAVASRLLAIVESVRGTLRTFSVSVEQGCMSALCYCLTALLRLSATSVPSLQRQLDALFLQLLAETSAEYRALGESERGAVERTLVQALARRLCTDSSSSLLVAAVLDFWRQHDISTALLPAALQAGAASCPSGGRRSATDSCSRAVVRVAPLSAAAAVSRKRVLGCDEPVTQQSQSQETSLERSHAAEQAAPAAEETRDRFDSSPARAARKSDRKVELIDRIVERLAVLRAAVLERAESEASGTLLALVNLDVAALILDMAS